MKPIDWRTEAILSHRAGSIMHARALGRAARKISREVQLRGGLSDLRQSYTARIAIALGIVALAAWIKHANK